MKKKDKKILEKAIGILNREGFKGYYDGLEADIMWSASKQIKKSIERIELHEPYNQEDD